MNTQHQPSGKAGTGHIGYHALYGTAPDGPEQIPGQLSITDIDPTIIADEGEVSA